MFCDFLRRIWSRRKASRRVEVRLAVRILGLNDQQFEVESEDIGDTGIRIRIEGAGLASVLEHREEVPLEITLKEDSQPISVDGRLIWAYRSSNGDTICGWQFVRYHDGAQESIASFLDERARKK